MSIPLSPQQSQLLSLVPADGSPIGNTALRRQLGWHESAYNTVCSGLVAAGLLEKGRGRGGSVRRANAGGVDGATRPQGDTTTSRPPVSLPQSPNIAHHSELFPPEEVESVVPELERARRAAALQPQPKPSTSPSSSVTEHRYTAATRKNLPAAGDALGHVEEAEKITYAYDPHRAPVLRFNEAITRQRALLDEARRRPLTAAEAEELAALLEVPQPWLEWAGKREQPDFAVDPVALHIHERVSAQAILRAVRREDIQRDLFADTTQSAKEARAYYQHDVAWANRLITGDSLQVMSSLARREGLAGQVQMIYLDPPYGIKFSSNWQNEVGKRDVKDKDEDLTREPEMIRAYRDTWTLGVHSYLAYLKQRLILTRELLKDSGSIFVQISDENLHRVRAVMDEVFGAENFCGIVAFRTTTGKASALLDSTCDFLVWYARCLKVHSINQVFISRSPDDDENLRTIFLRNGERRVAASAAHIQRLMEKTDGMIGRLNPITSQSGSDSTKFEVELAGRKFLPSKGGWKTNADGMCRLVRAERIGFSGETLGFWRFLNDFNVRPINNVWDDTRSSGFSDPKRYVVQTNERVIERCILMTTAPGDLVLDPTCGSGTTAYVAEQWGRRWITIDSSRVAVAIARQRLLTACYDTYKTKDPVAGVDPSTPQNPAHGFFYKTVPHITLKSIAQNKGLDPIFAKHEPILAARLSELNAALNTYTEPQSAEGRELRARLVSKLIKKLRDDARSVTDADERRWILPGTSPDLFQAAKGGPTARQASELRAFAALRETEWKEWEVPFDTDPDWPAPLAAALTAYRAAWRAKMDEVNAAIAANAEQEELVDQPEIVRGVTRVSGPFTVESMRPPESSLKGQADPETSPIDGTPEELDAFEATAVPERDVVQAAFHIERMLGLLKHDGLTFLGNKHAKFTQLDAIESSFLHGEGEFQAEDGKPHRVAVVIGPEFGSVTSFQVEAALRAVYRRGYDDIVFAGFSFDAMAQEVVEAENDRLKGEMRLHLAQIRPDVGMKDLLKKTQKVEQIFTVFGQPRTRVTTEGDEFIVHMDGVDIYDPVQNALQATTAAKVAAWFLDTDYDGKVFCICQAFFPDRSAWEKLSRALRTSVTEGAFEVLSGTTSLPFKPGPRQCAAVKVIDPRGNEVMRVHRLDREHMGREECKFF